MITNRADVGNTIDAEICLLMLAAPMLRSGRNTDHSLDLDAPI